MTITEAYKIFELSSSCSDDDINKAYRKLAMKHHPDKGGSEENFMLIVKAKQVLENRNKATYSINGRTYSEDEITNMKKEYIRRNREELARYEMESAYRFKLFLTRIIILVLYVIKIVLFSIIGIKGWPAALISLSVFWFLYWKAETVLKYFEKIRLKIKK